MKIYGFELYYMPRKPSNYDEILTEDSTNYYENAYPIEMYLQSNMGYEGESELLTKFGLEIRDAATFVVARKRWQEVIGKTGNSLLPRPCEGDLLFFPLTQSFFEIRKVEHHAPFYQVGKLYTFSLYCELMQFSNERINTGVAEIDQIAAGFDLSVGNFEIQLETDDSLLLETNELTPAILEGYTGDKPLVGSVNDVFESEKDSVLDFSEKNPFGEV
jgi:hypothetical protein